MCPKDADGMANSVDPNQTAPQAHYGNMMTDSWNLRHYMVVINFGLARSLYTWLQS